MIKRALSIAVGFGHDLAAGAWGATVLAVWWLHRAADEQPALRDVLGPLARELFWAGLACTALVMLLGVGRTFSYVPDFHGADAERLRRRMLIIKHVVLLVVFGGGTAWQYSLAFT